VNGAKLAAARARAEGRPPGWATDEVNARRSATARANLDRARLRRRVGVEALRRLPLALRRGDVREEWMRPFVAGMGDEVLALLQSRGGPEHASEAEVALVGDLAIVGAIMAAEAVRYWRTGDRESAARVASLANARRAGLLALGLKREARGITLDQYLAERERLAAAGVPPVASDAAIVSGREAEVVEVAADAAAGDGAREGGGAREAER
jgi:hypothetical protein